MPRPRCSWVNLRNPLNVAYHDKEWGRPVHDDRVHFEFLILEGAQAGLSWETILKKRERYRQVFANFNPQKVSRFSPSDVERLLRDPGIVRNRLKVESAIANARAFLTVAEELGSFDRYVWRFVDGRPIQTRFRTPSDYRSTTKESDALSKDLKKRGFRFVGSTIMYAYMQATGLTNDHALSCFRRSNSRRRPKASRR